MSTTERTVASLRDLVAGRVIALGDDDYDDARRVFAGQIDRHPAAIVRVTGPDDVARVIGLARETGAELAVRSGGHSGAGYGVAEGGLVIDVRDLRGFELDRDARTVWAGTGLTAAEYTAAAGDAGLVTGFGDTGSVGIGGITLGGGVGFLVRKHGLTIDDLLAAEIVTADGEIVLANEGSHPDLFWAIRGGGGNFGVATRFLFRLHPLEQIVGGMLFLPATADVVEGFMAASDKAPEELSTIANVMTAPPMPFLPEELVGTPVLMAFIVWAGAVEDGEKAVAPLRALAEPIADFVRPMTYPEMYMPEPEDYRPTAASFNGFLDELTAEDVATILSACRSRRGRCVPCNYGLSAVRWRASRTRRRRSPTGTGRSC